MHGHDDREWSIGLRPEDNTIMILLLLLIIIIVIMMIIMIMIVVLNILPIIEILIRGCKVRQLPAARNSHELLTS